MRGRLTEQDLTDYALNELPPDERLYVESLLGASEECRHDVIQMLELGEMLKTGFERNASADLALNEEQRAKVLHVPAWNWRGFLQKAAAILMLSAVTAFVVTQQGGRLASAGHAVNGMIADATEKGFARTVEEFRSRLDKLSTQGRGAEAEWQFAVQPAVCTPPVWIESLPEIAGM